MDINGLWIHWPNQCEYCKKSWTTAHCARNQSFMRKLNGMHQEYLGSLHFTCDYFVSDEEKIEKVKEQQTTMPCGGI